LSYENTRPAFLGDTPGAPGWQERRYSDGTARVIDEAVQRIVEQAFRRTVAALENQREVLERGASQLLEKETLDEKDLQALRTHLRPPAVAAQ
jgi:cell division protease FtsH